jgi:PAS domain S-box-containing protein
MVLQSHSDINTVPGSPVVLHIDDDPLSRELFLESFNLMYTVISLNSTENALHILNSHPVKVIVSDQRMAHETGIEFFKRIQDQHPDVIKILITAYSTMDTALQAINDGEVYRYLVKPWKREEVSGVLKDAIRQFDLGQDKKRLLSELRQKNEEIVIAYQKVLANEIKFHTICDKTNDSTFFLNDKKEIIEANRTFMDLIGFHGLPDELEALNAYVSKNCPLLIDKGLGVATSPDRSVMDSEFTLNTGELKIIEIRSSEINYNNGIYTLAIIRDISERKMFEKRLVQAILQTQEEEQSRYARELHDGLGPLLSSLKMHIQWIANPGNSANKDKIIHHAIYTIDHAIKCVKEIANNLSPHLLQRFGLIIAVNAYIKCVKESSQIEFSVTSNLRERLPTNIELILYRTILECINNSVKHSQAKKIMIRFSRQKNELQVNIADNGKGFDVPGQMENGKGMGLFNMQNRIWHIGGEFSVVSKINEGTEININIVLN